MELTHIKNLLIDGDGVLWRGEQPISGLGRFFEVLTRQGIRWGLLTNNSTQTPEAYVEKARQLGIEARKEAIFTSATVTATYLQEHYPTKETLYVIGERGLKQALKEGGFTLYEDEAQPERVAAVVVGMDRQINYQKLTVATRLIRGGADFMATNPDRTFPTPQGIAPGAGSLLAALVASTDVQPQVIGKPEPTIFEKAMQALGGKIETTAMIGDRLETDIEGAQRLGMGTILVLTGVTSRADLARSAIQPDLVLESVSALADALERM